MRVAGDGGVGIEVWVDGPEDGRPVLFMHGWPDTHELWRHQVAALSDAGFRAIAPDLRGFGASDKPGGAPANGTSGRASSRISSSTPSSTCWPSSARSASTAPTSSPTTGARP